MQRKQVKNDGPKPYNKFRGSKMWDKINAELLSNTHKIDLSDFRSPDHRINYRLASWSPYDASQRYYKNILFNLACNMPKKFFKYYRNIGNTDLGKPVYVTVQGLKINLDYLFSVQEIILLENILKTVQTIVEIGGGFGRTCHAIIKNFNNIENYTIVDLEPCLILSERYLKNVLKKGEIKKINFVKADYADEITYVDLVINVDSMAEMDPEICRNYLDLVDDRSVYFYSRNPVCKYLPESIGINKTKERDLKDVFKVGLCRDKKDIFNDETLKVSRKEYEKAYFPSENWTLVKSEISLPWQYYQHVLYRKLKDDKK